MKNIDWYHHIRRLSFFAFVFLAIWGAIQAASLYTIWNGMMPYFTWGESLRQALFVALWPITYAPFWYKFVFLGLGLWLILPYVFILDFR